MAEETDLVPAGEPVVAPEIPAAGADPAPGATATPETPEIPSGDPENPADPAPKPKKSAEEILKGRLGHTTKQLATREAEIAELNRKLEAAQSLIGAAPKPEGADPTPVRSDVNPTTGRVYTEAEFSQAVSERAQANAFNAQANAMYDDGATKFPDWKDSVDSLNAMQLMTPVLLDAAMATDDGAAVIHHLGGDLEEAQRIAALPPARMGAELAKIAMRLGTTKPTAISRAPAPVPPVDGAVKPTVDLDRVSQDDNMAAYVAARAKQGAKWARGRAN